MLLKRPKALTKYPNKISLPYQEYRPKIIELHVIDGVKHSKN